MPYYVSLSKLSAFRPRKMRAFRLGERETVVALVDGSFYAFENACTHQREYLTDGFIIDQQVVCGYHDATYELATGEAVYGPVIEPLAVFPVRIEGDEVQIEWPQPLPPEAVVYVDHDHDERLYDK